MSDRWHDQTCTACGAALTRGMTAFRLSVSRYAPMDPGPDWDCVGDWTDPEPFVGTLCGNCLDRVKDVILADLMTR